MTGAPVLWYVHHHGVGHWRRALAVVRRLQRDVVLMSSAEPPGPLPDNARFVRLAPDFPLDPGRNALRAEARGVLHWAPPHHRGLLDRHSEILNQAALMRPALAVVDVSVEVAVLLRTCGIPVIAVRLPGVRNDAAHRLGFDLADEVVMPVPARWGLQTGLARTTAVGLVSGLAPSVGDPRAASSAAVSDGPVAVSDGPVAVSDGPVAVMVGRGGSRIDHATAVRIAAEMPERPVRVLGLPKPLSRRAPGGRNLVFLGRIADPAAELAAAAVVVANCGLGTLADTVQASRPLVVLPEDRPFGEQRATGAALRTSGEAVVLDDVPAPGGWRTAIEAALVLGPPRLIADGARHFADLVEHRAAAEDAQRHLVVDVIPRPTLVRLPADDVVTIGTAR